MPFKNIKPKNIRVFPAESQRIETGVVQFGNDWPGIFIRGDRAIYLAFILSQYLVETNSSSIGAVVLRSLVNLLNECNTIPKNIKHEEIKS